MKIHEFAEKYGLQKRQVDYYTMKGLLNPKVCDNGYRDYSTCEEEVKGIILAKMMGYKINGENIRAILVLYESDVGKNYIRNMIELRFENMKADYRRAKNILAMDEP